MHFNKVISGIEINCITKLRKANIFRPPGMTTLLIYSELQDGLLVGDEDKHSLLTCQEDPSKKIILYSSYTAKMEMMSESKILFETL